jgi:hypothetical protein
MIVIIYGNGGLWLMLGGLCMLLSGCLLVVGHLCQEQPEENTGSSQQLQHDSASVPCHHAIRAYQREPVGAIVIVAPPSKAVAAFYVVSPSKPRDPRNLKVVKILDPSQNVEGIGKIPTWLKLPISLSNWHSSPRSLPIWGSI